MIANHGSQLSKTRFLTVRLLSARFIRTIRANGRWPVDFAQYFVAPDDYPHSRNHGPGYIPYKDLSPEDRKRRWAMPGRNWAKCLESILRQMPDLESLSCDFFPSMWKGLETYDTIPGLQNLHTLSMHGIGTLDIRLSALPKLRKLKLHHVELPESGDVCGVTDLEVIEDRGRYDRRFDLRPVRFLRAPKKSVLLPTFQVSPVLLA